MQDNPTQEVTEPVRPTKRTTELGVRTLVVYQNQVRLESQLWAAFTFASAALLLLAITFRVMRECRIATISQLLWTVPLVAFVLFARRNYTRMGLRLNELHLIRGATMSAAGLAFKPIETAASRRTHIAAQAAVGILYTVLWLA